MNNLPPLSPLPSFWAAARHSSFSKAAQELNVTHGAVSRAVRQLEDFFGFDLFERRNRGVHLTEKGKRFARRIDTLFSDLESACEELRSAGPGKLSVSCEPTLAMRWLMPRLDGFHRVLPDVEVLLSTAGGPIDLSEKGVHLAIRRSDFAWPARYWHVPLGKEAIGPVCSPAYWEENRKAPKRLLHTRTRPEAWADWRHHAGDVIETAEERFFDHFFFSLQAAAAGLGMAVGPFSMVQDAVEQGLLVAPFGFTVTDVDYVVICRTEPEPDGPARAFIHWLRETLALPRG